MTFRRQLIRACILTACMSGFGVAAFVAPRPDLSLAYISLAGGCLAALVKEFQHRPPNGNHPAGPADKLQDGTTLNKDKWP